MNREAFMAVRDRIAEVDETEVDMATWAGPDRGTDGSVVLMGDGPCGTTGCIAGHAIAILTGSFTTYFADGVCVGHRDGRDRSIVDVLNHAADLLDLTESQAEALFYETFWPEKYRQMMHTESQRKAMLAMLDDIIDGLLVYSVDYDGWTPIAQLEEELAAEFDDEGK